MDLKSEGSFIWNGRLMNQYYQIWCRLSKKIRSLLEMAESCSNLLRNNSSDSYDSMKVIAKHASSCFSDIEKFSKDFEQHFPREVLESFSAFIAENKEIFSSICTESNKELRNQSIISALMKISSFEAGSVTSFL